LAPEADNDTMPSMRSSATSRRLGVRQLVAWFLVGVVVAMFLQWLQVRALGGDWTSLVNAGRQSALRPLIEAELGPVTTVEQAGHDGQFSYLIALDPLGQGEAPDLFDHGAYRYRRILLPALGGGFGLLSGEAALVGLMVWSIVGMGLATAAIADLGAARGTRPWVVAGVLANPGVWLSVQLLTPDVLALGLALGGVALWLRDYRVAGVAALALAALTKDQYLLVAAGLAGWEWFRVHRRESFLLMTGATLPLVIWSIFLTISMGEGLTPRGNFSIPFVGIIDAAGGWANTGTKDLVFSLIATAGLLAAAFVSFVTQSRLLRWLTWPWVVLAVVSSGWVWNLGNNSLRVFAPLLALAVLGVAALTESKTRAEFA
jgi:hypothetical protein